MWILCNIYIFSYFLERSWGGENPAGAGRPGPQDRRTGGAHTVGNPRIFMSLIGCVGGFESGLSEVEWLLYEQAVGWLKTGGIRLYERYAITTARVENLYLGIWIQSLSSPFSS